MKERIVIILDKNNLTYSDLLYEINSNDAQQQFSEKELDIGIEKLNTHVLERISKVLRIPLYSFYRKEEEPKPIERGFYDEDIWKYDDKNKKT